MISLTVKFVGVSENLKTLPSLIGPVALLKPETSLRLNCIFDCVSLRAFRHVTWISGIPVLSHGRRWWIESLMHSMMAGSDDRHCFMYGAENQLKCIKIMLLWGMKIFLFRAFEGNSVASNQWNKSWISFCVITPALQPQNAYSTHHTKFSLARSSSLFPIYF